MAMCCSLLFDNVVRFHKLPTNHGCQCCNARVSHTRVLYDLRILSLRGSACQYYVTVVAIVAHNVQFGVEIMKSILTRFEGGLTTR